MPGRKAVAHSSVFCCGAQYLRRPAQLRPGALLWQAAVLGDCSWATAAGNGLWQGSNNSNCTLGCEDLLSPVKVGLLEKLGASRKLRRRRTLTLSGIAMAACARRRGPSFPLRSAQSAKRQLPLKTGPCFPSPNRCSESARLCRRLTYYFIVTRNQASRSLWREVELRAWKNAAVIFHL
jgi:hypothetical protein